MRRILIALLLLTLLDSARAEDSAWDRFFVPHNWSTTEYAMLGVAEVAEVMDWRQTQNIGKNCRSGGTLYEKNPILGKCPSNAAINTYFALSAVSIYLVGNALEGTWRKGWIISVGATEGAMINSNNKVGLFVFGTAVF